MVFVAHITKKVFVSQIKTHKIHLKKLKKQHKGKRQFTEDSMWSVNMCTKDTETCQSLGNTR